MRTSLVASLFRAETSMKQLESLKILWMHVDALEFGAEWLPGRSKQSVASGTILLILDSHNVSIPNTLC